MQLQRSSNFNEAPLSARETPEPSKVQAVRCPHGHVMQAIVVREMFRGLEAFRSEIRCARCKQSITTQDARYSCEECNISYCTACSANILCKPLLESVARPLQGRQIRRSPSNVMAGDIICCGPDRWGIHHLILVISAMEPDQEALPFLYADKDSEVWSCETIECTQTRVGREVPWFRTRTFYVRDPSTGAAAMAGSLEPGTLNIESFETPVPVKLLMHPLRKGYGGPPFDAKAFSQAVQRSAVVSQRWGLATAIKGLFAREESLDPDNYPMPELRRKLMEELTARWSSKPICSSVVIMVWQNYFKIACRSAGAGGDDLAAQHILRWMPLLSDKTMPSVLLKVLTKLGWVLRGNIDA